MPYINIFLSPLSSLPSFYLHSFSLPIFISYPVSLQILLSFSFSLSLLPFLLSALSSVLRSALARVVSAPHDGKPVWAIHSSRPSLSARTRRMDSADTSLLTEDARVRWGREERRRKRKAGENVEASEREKERKRKREEESVFSFSNIFLSPLSLPLSLSLVSSFLFPPILG